MSEERPTPGKLMAETGEESDALLEDSDLGQATATSTAPPPTAVGPISTIPLDHDAYAPPYYIRYRLATWVGVLLSILWVVLSFNFINEQIAWNDIGELLPHELGGMAAGTATPLALLWMVIAFFERGRQLRYESQALHWYFRRLIYPADGAETRLGQISESLRRQAREMTQASEVAAARAEAIDHTVRRRTEALARVSEDADLRAQSIAEALRRQTEDLFGVSERAEKRAREAGETLARESQNLSASADRASARAESLNELLHQ